MIFARFFMVMNILRFLKTLIFHAPKAKWVLRFESKRLLALNFEALGISGTPRGDQQSLKEKTKRDSTAGEKRLSRANSREAMEAPPTPGKPQRLSRPLAAAVAPKRSAALRRRL